MVQTKEQAEKQAGKVEAKPPRKHYLDNIRWFTVVLVVFYHVIYMFNGIIGAGVIGAFREHQYEEAIQYVLYPWFMVILFIVSGISARHYLEWHTTKEFVKSRTRKLLVPSTLGLLVAGWIQGYFNTLFSGAQESLAALPPVIYYLILCVSGTGVLWYIQMLWIESMALILIRKLEKGRLERWCEKINFLILLLLGIVVWASAQVLNTPVIAVYRFGIYSVAFFLGYFVFYYETVIDILAKWSIPLLAAAGVLAGIFTAVYFGENYAIEPVVNSPLSVAYGWIACLAVMGAAKRWGNISNPFTEYMRKRSFGIYVFHYLCISVSGYLLVSYTSLAPVWIYLLVSAAAFAGAILLYEIISRIPVIRYFVLGIKKEC